MTVVNGYRARWRDGDYDASPDGALLRLYSDTPVPGFQQVRPGRYRRVVAIDEAQWFGYVRTVATLRAEPVVLLAERGDQVLVEYRGDLPEGPSWWDGERPEPGVCRAWVIRAALREEREERTPAT